MSNQGEQRDHPEPPVETIVYDEDADTYRVTLVSSAANNPLVAVLWSVATIEDVKPIDLPPIAKWIDPDALSRLFDCPAGEHVSITFPYDGYRVTIEGNDGIKIAEKRNS